MMSMKSKHKPVRSSSELSKRKRRPRAAGENTFDADACDDNIVKNVVYSGALKIADDFYKVTITEVPHNECCIL